MLVFDGFGQRVKSLLIEYFLDQVITRGVEKDGDKEHHKEHTEDYHAVETEQMDRGAKLEGHHAEPKQYYAHNHEDPIEDIGTKFNEEKDVCCHETQRGQENKEVEDVEEHVNALVSFLVIHLEGVFSRVQL